MTLEELREQAAKDHILQSAKMVSDARDIIERLRMWCRNQKLIDEANGLLSRIGAIPLPAPVALPQAGEVVAWLYTKANGERTVFLERQDWQIMTPTETALGPVSPTPTETPTAAAQDDMQQLHSDIIHRCTYAERLPGKAYVMRYTDVAAFVLEDREYHRTPAPDDGLMGRYREALEDVRIRAGYLRLFIEDGKIDDGLADIIRTVVRALSTATGDEAQQGEG